VKSNKASEFIGPVNDLRSHE